MKSTIQGSSELSVGAKPESIWELLEDSSKLSTWAPMIKHTTGRKERVGSTRSCQVEWEGRKDEVFERCIEASPPHRIMWQMERGQMTRLFSTFQFGFELIPQGTGRTLIRMPYRYEPRNVFARLMYSFLMARKMEEMRRGLLQNLKRVVEPCEKPESETAGAGSPVETAITK